MRRIALLTLALLGPLLPATAAHAVGWLAPVDLPGDSLYGGSVAMDGAGDIYIAVVRAFDGPSTEGEGFYVMERPAGGGPIVDVARLGDNSAENSFGIVANTRGDVAVVYTGDPSGACPAMLHVSVKPAGRPFDGAKTLEVGCNGQVGIDDDGNVTVAYLHDDGGGNRVRMTTIPFGGEPATPTYLSVAGKNVTEGTLVLQENGAGDAVLAWSRSTTGAHQFAVAATRPRGATFGASNSITTDDGFDPPFNGFGGSISLGPDGTIGMLSTETNASHAAVKEFSHVGSAAAGVSDGVLVSGFSTPSPLHQLASVVASGGAVTAFGIDGPNQLAVQPFIAPVTAAGTGTTSPYLLPDEVPYYATPTLAGGYVQAAVFKINQPDGQLVLVHQPPDGGTPVITRTPQLEQIPLRPAVSSAGDAAIVAIEETDPGRLFVLDATPPSITSTAIPAGGTPGQVLTFSAGASDATSSVSYHWDFGDGSAADGPSVSHAFPVAGTYTVTVTVTDQAANSASSGGAVAVATPVIPAPPLKPIPSAPLVRCHVPTLTGHTEAYVKKALTKAHCKLGTVKRPSKRSERHSSKLRVRSQTIKHGSYKTKDTKVGITLAIPKPKKRK